MVTRRLEKEGVHERVPQGGHVPQEVQISQGLQIPPQVDQVPIEGGGNEVLVVPPDMNNGEIRDVLLALDQAMITRVNRDVEPRLML